MNAARVMRARALRWLELRASVETDSEANKTLWEELKAPREEQAASTPDAQGRCAHENDADVNAARVMRARALRWLELRANAETDGEAHKALWDELKTRREAHGMNTGRAGATTKPACASSGEDNGGAGAPSTAPASVGTPRDGPGTGGAEGGAHRGA